MSTLFAILYRQSDQVLHCLPFSTVWPGSTLFAILSSPIKVYTVCHFSAVSSRFQIFAILSNLVFYNDCHSQKSDQGLHFFSILSSLIMVYTSCHSQFDQRLHWLPFSPVWSGSTLVAILSLIKVYPVRHSQESHQRLQYLPFFLSSIIKVYTVFHSQQSDQDLHCLPFSAVRSAYTMFALLSSLFRV